ncbi:unnamed protein product [Calypogeia fissa]
MRADEECGRRSDDLRPTDEEEEEEEGGGEASSSSSFFFFPCRRAAVENCARCRLRAGFSVVRIGNRHWLWSRMLLWKHGAGRAVVVSGTVATTAERKPAFAVDAGFD